ncbi:MAG: hypothetical protein Q8P18_14415 [Pseudomonadota bacterium]|nr:hypothetical protein [Pseudomonadota bacterium]
MWLLFFLACTGAPLKEDSAAPDGCFSEPATVEVGGGSLAFEPVADGAEMTMVHGPQGGWHVLASARFSDVNPIVAIHYTVAVTSGAGAGQIVVDNEYRVLIVEDVECGGYYPGMYGYLDVSALADGELDTPPELLAGQDLLLRMDVTDLDGRVASDTLTGRAALDPVDAD